MNMGIVPIKRQFLNVEHCKDDMLLFPANIDPQVKLTASALQDSKSGNWASVWNSGGGGPSCQDDGGTITNFYPHVPKTVRASGHRTQMQGWFRVRMFINKHSKAEQTKGCERPNALSSVTMSGRLLLWKIIKITLSKWEENRKAIDDNQTNSRSPNEADLTKGALLKNRGTMKH